MPARRVLVCAPLLPEMDREGGSRRMFHFLEMFVQAGWSVTFLAGNGKSGERYAQKLQQMGVAVFALYGSWTGNEHACVDLESLLKPDHFDLALFAFWYTAAEYIPVVRRLSFHTAVVVDSVDVQFLRESRRVFSGGNGDRLLRALDASYGNATMREINAYAVADAVLTVSDKEAGLINDLLGRRVALTIPDTEDIELSATPFEERRGMLFIGNFRHPPNVEAIEYFCGHVAPKLPPGLLERHPVDVIGNQPTESVVEWCRKTPGVRLVGWTPSILPYLMNSRISLVPLLHGAGTKRKLMQSMMAGTPSVSTSIGAEGFSVRNGEQVLIADSADDFAAAIQRLVDDRELWSRVAQSGREFAESHHGRPAVARQFSAVFDDVLRRSKRPRVFWEEFEPGALSQFDKEGDAAARREIATTGRMSGYCNTANVETTFTMTSELTREELRASVSGAINRNRVLICGLSVAMFGHPHSSLAGICAHINKRQLHVYMAESESVLADFFRRHLEPRLFVSSEYCGPDHASGETIDGIRHEDLQKTSFENEQFDIVLTAEVLEHVPDAIRAEREIMRILKAGGLYCFTVPLTPNGLKDQVLAELDEEGSIRYLEPPQYHGDPRRPEGILVYRIFSPTNLKERFAGMGHDLRTYRFWSKALGILGDDGFTHVVRKQA